MRLNSKLPVHSDPHTVLEAILDRHPLIVQSTVSYKEAVELMGATWSSQCQLSQTDTQSDSLQLSEVTSNALLVLSEQKFQGIFTERDLVRIASNALFSETHTVGELVREAPVTLKLRDFQDIFSVVHLMRQHQIRDLPILSETEQVIGIISFERIRQILQPIDLLKFRQIKEVMISDVICASPGDTVQSVTRLLTEHQISSVVITDSSGTTQDSAEVDAAVCRPVGIITERDIVQYQFLELNLENIQVAQVMSTPLFLIQTHDSIWQAHRRMQEKQIRRLVVVDQAGQLAGILTQSQILQILDPSEMYDIMTMLQ
ncbi:MAG: CBS domain-containing protein, partial [Cyanobacteria bacterium P01_F01_bin.3]